MTKKIAIPTLCFAVILVSALSSLNLKGTDAAPAVGSKTLILYDAASGTVPSAPLMNFTDFPPGAAPPTFSNGATVMDTTTSGHDTYAGWISSGAAIAEFPILDRTAGFQVNFTMQLEQESHRNENRAGFSIIVLSADAKGIELAFWQNEIWAQSDDNTGGLFKHGEGIAFATTNGLTDYQVTILNDGYTLNANGRSILAGPLRDYSKFDGFPDPYEMPNFLFLGDNTTSAESRVRLSSVSIAGIEPVSATATGTSTSITTPTPPPTDSPTPRPTVTLLPTRTPTRKVFEPCPSSGFLVMLVVALVIRKIGQGKDSPGGS